MSSLQSNNTRPVSGWWLIGVSAAFIVIALMIIIGSPDPDTQRFGWAGLVVVSPVLLLGIIRVAVAGAMYQLEEQNRRIIELLRQINEKAQDND